MKHATSRMLFAYWDGLRGERRAPERHELRPGDIRHILADTFLLEASEPGILAVRSVGRRCSALLGPPFQARPFTAAWATAERGEAVELVETVRTDGVGVAAGLLGTNDNGSEVALELVLLPLRHRGRTGSRILGALSPIALPAWAGLVPIRHLRTRSLRIIDTTRQSVSGATTRPAPLLILHQGGRAEARSPAEAAGLDAVPTPTSDPRD